jgi:hypothetical protein
MSMRSNLLQHNGNLHDQIDMTLGNSRQHLMTTRSGHGGRKVQEVEGVGEPNRKANVGKAILFVILVVYLHEPLAGLV